MSRKRKIKSARISIFSDKPDWLTMNSGRKYMKPKITSSKTSAIDALLSLPEPK